MKLLLDLGNTRLKACLSDNQQLSLLSTVVDEQTLTVWLEAHAKKLSGIAVASVSQQRVYQAMMSALAPHYDSEKIYRASYDSSVMKSAYDNPSSLGIDRWLALLPFRTEPCVIVVDAGTAFTLDVIRSGSHIGGYILPGIQLQRDALAMQTAAVNFSLANLADLDVGRTTAACVGHGSLRALIALTKATLEDFASCGARLVITGGDAPYFAPHVLAEFRPLLVFEGLRIALSKHEGGIV